MTDRYYAATRKSYDHHGCTELWKTNDSLQLCADKGDPQGFGLTAYVAIDFVFDDSFLDDQRYESVRRITQDAFDPSNWVQVCKTTYTYVKGWFSAGALHSLEPRVVQMWFKYSKKIPN